MSEAGTTVDVMVAELLAGTASTTLDDTVARSVMPPTAIARTPMVITAGAPAPTVPRLQITLLPLTTAEPCETSTEANVTPGASVLVTIVLVAPTGPLLVTLMV